MASILKVDELRGIASAGDITVTSEGGAATQSLQQGLAKAWAMIDGTGAVAYRDSFNTSGLTDVSTGNYTMTVSSALANGNYACPCTCGGQETTSTNNLEVPHRNTDPTTTALRATYSNGNQDCDFLTMSILGDLA